MNPYVPPTPEEIEEDLKELRRKLAAPKKRITDVMLMDYRDQYLRSAGWRRIKKRVLERDQHICQSCGGVGDVVHHRTYSREVLEGKDDSMLSTVCSGCHDFIHFTDDGTKRSESKTDVLLLTGRRQTDIPDIKIDLRKPIPSMPENWHRMTAAQHAIWYETFSRLRREKLLKKNKNKPPRQPGGFFSPEFWRDKCSVTTAKTTNPSTKRSTSR